MKALLLLVAGLALALSSIAPDGGRADLIFWELRERQCARFGISWFPFSRSRLPAEWRMPRGVRTSRHNLLPRRRNLPQEIRARSSAMCAAAGRSKRDVASKSPARSPRKSATSERGGSKRRFLARFAMVGE
jgi:hypothetical protein